jgi:hypothetical protein
MRLPVATLLLRAIAPTMADLSFRFGDAVAATGGGIVVGKAGRRPDRVAVPGNSRGAAVGERWESFLEDRQVDIELRDGKVVGIEERG